MKIAVWLVGQKDPGTPTEWNCPPKGHEVFQQEKTSWRKPAAAAWASVTFPWLVTPRMEDRTTLAMALGPCVVISGQIPLPPPILRASHRHSSPTHEKWSREQETCSEDPRTGISIQTYIHSNRLSIVGVKLLTAISIRSVCGDKVRKLLTIVWPWKGRKSEPQWLTCQWKV